MAEDDLAARTAPTNAHPAPPGQPLPPAPDVATLRVRAAALLPDIAREAADRELRRELPYALARQVANAGLLTFRIPRAYGGPGGSVREAFAFVIDLAAADANLAQALRPNFALVEGLLAGQDNEAERRRWFDRLLAGQILGNGGMERGGKHGDVKTTIVPRDGHFVVHGTKYYSTGALYADWVTSIAVDEAGEETHFAVPRDRAGMALVDDFDTIGQRLTASGSTHFDQTRVEADELRPSPFSRGRRNAVTPVLQLFLAATEAGIARNALTDATWYARHKARPIKHSSAARSVDDPYVQETIGQIAAQAFAAEAAVLRAAEAIDAAWADGLGDAALTRASVEVAQAQYFAVAAALRSAELVFDVGGASTCDRQYNLDRHWRNARTVANHNPRQWKAAAVGAWLLKDEPPPTTGLF
ncbi:acyl-CoA dehydrogenase family protein [Cupriavidus agavae]|uniref:Alkylation response protein AidB-like acyl-CoA dehydrogenase n=1 Tax=Cupriavidus agavae TaxID=1001822 RepID=A0A4Q7RFI8_9BURK|nr:acyl-CoA dehydrogenase family protein [Cupriavidus agavae]RZT31387.1 alkylation response protein AidB-like acyl-CoA dehydrogenase [Cupriavidus agavae]